MSSVTGAASGAAFSLFAVNVFSQSLWWHDHSVLELGLLNGCGAMIIAAVAYSNKDSEEDAVTEQLEEGRESEGAPKVHSGHARDPLWHWAELMTIAFATFFAVEGAAQAGAVVAAPSEGAHFALPTVLRNVPLAVLITAVYEVLSRSASQTILVPGMVVGTQQAMALLGLTASLRPYTSDGKWVDAARSVACGMLAMLAYIYFLLGSSSGKQGPGVVLGVLFGTFAVLIPWVSSALLCINTPYCSDYHFIKTAM